MNDKINSLNETIENHVVEQNNFIESQNKLVQSTLNNQEEYFNNKFRWIKEIYLWYTWWLKSREVIIILLPVENTTLNTQSQEK